MTPKVGGILALRIENYNISASADKVTRTGNQTQPLHKEDVLHDHYAIQASFGSKLHYLYVYIL